MRVYDHASKKKNHLVRKKPYAIEKIILNLYDSISEVNRPARCPERDCNYRTRCYVKTMKPGEQ